MRRSHFLYQFLPLDAPGSLRLLQKYATVQALGHRSISSAMYVGVIDSQAARETSRTLMAPSIEAIGATLSHSRGLKRDSMS